MLNSFMLLIFNYFRILEEAKKEFEEAARALFEHTITLGKEIRPKAFWGFYGFPDCYGNKDFGYQCIEKVPFIF